MMIVMTDDTRYYDGRAKKLSIEIQAPKVVNNDEVISRFKSADIVLRLESCTVLRIQCVNVVARFNYDRMVSQFGGDDMIITIRVP